MEHDKSKCPSLPSNYVSLLQLQERRLKEKERNERGDEEGELKNKEEQEGLGNIDNVILKENPKGKVVANTDSCFSCPTWNRNRWYHSEKCAQRMEWSKHKEEFSIEAFWGRNEDGKTDGLKKEEKWIWRNKEKARAEGEVQLVTKNGAGENAPVIVTFVKEKSNVKRLEKGGELKLKGVVVEEKITEENHTRDLVTMPSGKESTDGLKKEEKRIWRNKGKARAEGEAHLLAKKGTGVNAPVIVTFVKEKINMKRREKGSELKLKGVVVEEKITEENPTRDSATMPFGKESKDISMVEIGGERRRDKKAMSEYWRNGDPHQMKTDIHEQKVTKDPAVEIERNFQNMALDGERWNNMRFRAGVHGGKWRYKGRSGSFGPPRMQKQRDDRFVWVKKGEVSNTK